MMYSFKLVDTEVEGPKSQCSFIQDFCPQPFQLHQKSLSPKFLLRESPGAALLSFAAPLDSLDE